MATTTDRPAHRTKHGICAHCGKETNGGNLCIRHVHLRSEYPAADNPT